MAKSKGKSHLGGRDYTPIATRDPLQSLLVPRPALSVSWLSPTLETDVFEDRREWHPEGVNRPALGAPRAATRPVAKQRPAFSVPSQTKGIIAFAEPNRVAVCVRRKVRKQVMHALNKAGGKGHRRPRRNAQSSISCR